MSGFEASMKLCKDLFAASEVIVAQVRDVPDTLQLVNRVNVRTIFEVKLTKSARISRNRPFRAWRNRSLSGILFSAL